MPPAELWPFVLLALAGSLHCAGMCGPFALLAARGPRTSAGLARVSLLAGGKALSYAALGAILAAGARLVLGPLGLGAEPELRAPLAWLAGGALVLAGLGSLLARSSLPRVLSRVPILERARTRSAAAVGLFAARARALPGAAGTFGGGVALGLLPCGLSWAALALAARHAPPVAALAMALFGLATAPALLGVAAAARIAPAALRARARPLAGLLLVALGLVTLARGGLPAAAASLRAALPACCAESGAQVEPPAPAPAPLD